VYLCSSADVDGVSGRYFVNCKAVQPKAWAQDDAAAAHLWTYTEQATGFSYPV
jgi:hypothetical protein